MMTTTSDCKDRSSILRIFFHEKYDLDVGIMLFHFGWSTITILDIIFADQITAGMTDQIFDGDPMTREILAIISLLCAILHYMNIFCVRKPVWRVCIYTILAFWGFVISLALIPAFGVLNIGSLTYLVWFVIMPARKIFQILQDAMEEFNYEMREAQKDYGEEVQDEDESRL